MVFSMLTHKQILAQKTQALLCLGVFLGNCSQAFAATLSEFDQKQNERLTIIQESIRSNKFDRKLAQDKLAEVNAQLEAYGALGPNQKIAISQLAAEKIKKDILKELEDAAVASEEGYEIPQILNDKLRKQYGIVLVSESGKWKAEIAGSTSQEVETSQKRFSEAVAQKTASYWKGISENERELVSKKVLRGLNTEIKELLPEDGKITASLKENVEKRVLALGDEKKGKIQELDREISSAKLADQSEKRLLQAEKKTYDSFEKKEGDKSIDDFCKEFAGGGLTSLDLTRRRSALEGKNDPCDKSFELALADLKNNTKEKPQIAKDGEGSGSPKEGVASNLDPSKATSLGGVSAPHSTPTTPPPSTEPTKTDEVNDPGRSLAEGRPKVPTLLSEEEKKKLANVDPKLAEKIKALETERGQLKGAIDSRNRQDFINACNQAASNLKKSIGLGSDNEKNEKIVSSISDKLEKTLAKGYQGLVCEKSGVNDGLATYSSMEEASKDVLKGLGIPPTGPLTQSKQNTLESLSKGAMEVAANFANQRRNRTKLDFQMLEAASKKAISRITTENPDLVDANTLSYLRTLSYNELMGYSSGNPELDIMYGSSGGGVLTKLLPPYALQTYQNYFDIALMDIKQKNGIREEFDKQAECAFAFAQVASQRHSEEEERKRLIGVRVRGPSSSALPVNDGPTVRNEESTRKVERNR
jgi:hypothetical protein